MTLRLSVAAIGLLLSGSVFSAVTITAPEEIVILAVNGQEVNSGLFRSSKNSYKVDAGETNLSVRYQEYFEHLNGEHDIVKSGVVTIQTPTLKDGQTYKLAMVDVPKNMSKQRNMLSNQQWLYIIQIELVVQQTGANNEAKPWFATGLLGKVADFTTKPSKPQPQAVYAAAKPSTSQFTTSVAATIPSTGAAQSNDQRF
ncbi:DUF2057 family protein [Acinetobacter seifertii]|nr:DUF2057 family protein [Acinetobacter seifertii]